MRTLLCGAGLPSCFWPWAAPCFCFLENTAIDPETGKSPWYNRHGEHFKGPRIPFGCGVYFAPADTKYKNSKAAPALSWGIFLGYKLGTGGKWSGDFYVADLFDFMDKSLHVDTAPENFDVRPHTTDICKMSIRKGPCYPLRERYDKANMTLEGVEAFWHDYSREDYGPNGPPRTDSSGKPLDPKAHTYTQDAYVQESNAAQEELVKSEEAIASDDAEPVVPSTPDDLIVTEEDVAHFFFVHEQGVDSEGKKMTVTDRAGRTYPADTYGTRIVRSRRPPTIDSYHWNRMNRPEQRRAMWAARHLASKAIVAEMPSPVSPDDNPDLGDTVEAATQQQDGASQPQNGTNGPHESSIKDVSAPSGSDGRHWEQIEDCAVDADPDEEYIDADAAEVTQVQHSDALET